MRIILSIFCGALFAVLATTPSYAGPYTWVTVSSDGNRPWPMNTLSFSASVIETGSFSLSGLCHDGPPFNCAPGFYTGNFGNFAIQDNFGMFPIIDLAINVGFNLDGTLSGSTRFYDVGADWVLSGSGNNWSGFYNGDFINCSNPNPCTVKGYWQGAPIPEPMTIGVFGLGVAGLAIARRKLRSCSTIGETH